MHMDNCYSSADVRLLFKILKLLVYMNFKSTSQANNLELKNGVESVLKSSVRSERHLTTRHDVGALKSSAVSIDLIIQMYLYGKLTNLLSEQRGARAHVHSHKSNNGVFTLL